MTSPDIHRSLPSHTPGFRDLLAQRAYMGFWASRLLTTMGSQMLMVAIGWHMYELTASAWDLGLVGLFQFVPALLLTLPAGHMADRLHRARIVAVCVGVQTLVAIALVLIAWPSIAPSLTANTGRWLLLSLSIVLGAVRAFQMPAQQALTAMLVPPTLLPRAMAFTASGTQSAIIVGPALGGFLFAAGTEVVYAISAGFTLLASALLLTVNYQYIPPARQPITLQTLTAGFSFVWQRKVILGAVSLDLFAVLLGGAVALLPMFVKDVLQTDAWGLGILRAAPAVGALLMSVALTRWPPAQRVGRTLLISVGIFGLATVAFGLSKSLWLSAFALAITGAADMISVVIRQTLVQLGTPNEMRGRVSAINSIFIGASNQLGEFESGATAALFGPVAATVIGGIGTIAVAIGWFKLFPDLAKKDQMH